MCCGLSEVGVALVLRQSVVVQHFVVLLGGCLVTVAGLEVVVQRILQVEKWLECLLGWLVSWRSKLVELLGWYVACGRLQVSWLLVCGVCVVFLWVVLEGLEHLSLVRFWWEIDLSRAE